MGTCTKGPRGITSLTVSINNRPSLNLNGDARHASLGQGNNMGETFGPSAMRGCNSGISWARGEVLGHGSLGCVFKALNQQTGEIFAVKEVRIDSKLDTDL